MKIRFVPFEKLPYSDTSWALIEGPDDCVYAASCCEMTAGGTVFVVRYDPKTEKLEYLLDVAEAVGQSPQNDRATQCKIHYSMLVDDEGVMYGATHLSGPAKSQLQYNPWSTFDDPRRSYVGSRMFAYDCGVEKVLWTDTLIPWEGCRCLALDQKRRRLYAVGYPRDHFYMWEIDTHQRHDLGRIGSVNPQAIWLDSRDRAYTTTDYGKILVYDPEREDLSQTDLQTPCAPYQKGWHNVVYDAVKVPGTDDVVGVNWNLAPYLFRFSPGDKSGTGRLQNLGPASPGIEGRKLRGVNTDHAGGLVFTAGGELLFSVSRTRGAGASGRVATLKKMDLESREVEVLGDLVDETGVEIAYISRAVRIGPRDLVMGVVGRIPTGIVHVKLDEELANGPYQETQRRYWG